MPHQLFAAGLQARDIYPELSKYFYRGHSNVTWEEFLTTRFGLWIDTHSTPETGGGDLTCYAFSLEVAVADLSVTDPSRISTIEK